MIAAGREPASNHWNCSMEKSLAQSSNHQGSTTSAETVTYGLHWQIVPLLLVLNLGFVVLGIYITFAKAEADLYGRLVGLFCTGFFGLTLGTTISDLFIRGPILIIDAQGIWDKRMSPRPIPWHNVRKADKIGRAHV